MTPVRARVTYCLTRHFFEGLFDFGFLSDAGVASYKRLILGICAAFFSFGLLLARVLMVKYANLMAADSPEPYRQALLGDHALLIAIPMWIVAFVTVLVGHALFPSELDLRVLMPLPVTRRLVFGTRLLAVALFAGLFVTAAHVAIAPLFLLMSFGPWAEGMFVVRAAAFGAASLGGSMFVVLAVVAVHGMLLLGATRGHLLTVSATARSAMLCGLVLCLPFLIRLSTPSAIRGTIGGAWWLPFAPPAWFLGVERWLLGDDRSSLIGLAYTAVVAGVLVAALTASAYAQLYRHCDRLLLRPPARPQRSGWRAATTWVGRRRVSRPVFLAIRAFTFVTLRRSVLHQGIVVALTAAGAGLALNSLIGAGMGDWAARGGTPSRRLVDSAIWVPFAMTFAVSLAVRAALMVPIELRANWVFRVTERDQARLDQLSAATYVVGGLGVAAPVALVLPLQWSLLGTGAVPVAFVTLLCGWLFVELLMQSWGRVPFTCSYLPGKGFVPQTILAGIFSFTTFTMVGAALARFSATLHPVALVLDALVLAVVLGLRYRRRRRWETTPLEFEDQLPTDVMPLRLSSD